MKWAVIYSSVTGNTKKLAEAAAKGLNADIFPVNNILLLLKYPFSQYFHLTIMLN